MGPQLCAARARTESDPARQRAILAEGEALLPGTLSHSHFFFCEAAIQVAMDQRDWEEAERFARLLDDYTAAEPVPWTQAVLRRARALCRLGRGERSAALHAELLVVREHALAAESVALMAGIDAAIAQAEVVAS
jgi:hypothetical protein